MIMAYLLMYIFHHKQTFQLQIVQDSHLSTVQSDILSKHFQVESLQFLLSNARQYLVIVNAKIYKIYKNHINSYH